MKKGLLNEVNALVETMVRQTYEGTDVNDMSLGSACAWSILYSEAEDKQKEAKAAIKEGIELEGPFEKHVVAFDPKFEAEATYRNGQTKLDKDKLRLEFVALLIEKGMPRVKAIELVHKLIAKCSDVGKPSIAISVREK